MRVAFFSPLNPLPSGISDYSEELLPYLARHVEIELIVEGYVPTNAALGIFPRRTLDEFRARAASYDVILYQMGNSPAHAQIYETLLNYPGVVVMHDVVLHHLRAWLTLERGRTDAYRAALAEQYGEEGERAAEDEIERRVISDRFALALNQEVVRAARGLIVHSAYAAREIQPLAPNTPLAMIPMGVPIPPLAGSSEARAALHLPSDAFIVAAFGEIHPYKRVLPALAAFAEFRTRHRDAMFLLVGRAAPMFDVREAARGLKVEDAVRVEGYAPRGVYEQYIAAADVCLNLRYPSAGETSASLLRLLAAGRVTFVTNADAAAELPASVCVRIEPDAFEEPLLVAYLTYFAENPEARAAMGERARRFVQEHHTLEGAAEAYAEFLKRFEKGDGTRSAG